MKNKNIKKNSSYADGGKIFDIIGQLAPLLNAIPAVGPAAAPLISMGASFLGNQAREQNNQQGQQNATGYTNSSAFGYADGGNIGPGDPKKKLKPISPSELWKHKGKLLDIADIGADITDLIGIAGGVGAAPFNNVLGPIQASRSLKNGKPLKAMFDMVPMNSLWMPSFMEKAISSDEANNGIINAAKSVPNAAGVFRNQIKQKFGFESGGQVDPGKKNRFGYTEEQINQALRLKRVYEDSGSPLINYIAPNERSWYDRNNNSLNLARPEEALGELAHAYQRNTLQSMNDKKYANSNGIPLANSSNQFNPDFLHNAEFTARKRDQEYVNNMFRQSKEGKQSSLNFLNDQLLSDKITDSQLYNIPGTIEYNAHQEIEPSMRNYINKGFESGGDLSKIANGAYQVNGAPHMTDGNAINYKGQNINLDYGETLDTNKDRVISDKYFNPETGKKFSDEDKSLKRIRAKSEKSNALSSDPAARGTIDITSKMEDDLFNKQEMIASLLGDRNNNDMKRTQQAQRTPAFGYEEGGQLQPVDKAQDLLNQMREMIQIMNRVKPLDQSTRPEVFPEDVVWRDNNNQPIDNTIPASKEVSTTRPTSRKNNKVAEIQNKLISLGFDNIGKAGVKGDVDGIMGARTKAALRKAIASKKLDESYSRFLNQSTQEKKKSSSQVNNQANVARTVTDELMPQYDDNETSDYKFNTDIDWQKMMANSKQKPKYMPDPKKKKEKSIGVADLMYGNSKYYAQGGYIDPLQQLGLKPLGQVTPTYDPTLAARSLSSLSPVRTSSTNQPGLSNVSSIINSIGSGTEARNNPFNQMTLGEKIGLGSSALSVALKGIESFQPLQKEPYRYNNAGISLNQLDPTAVLNQNQASYTASLNDINNQSTTGSNRQAILSSLYSNKMKSDSDIMGKYNELNSNNATQYEQRLAQRNAENNAMSYQVDDLNSRNKGARENMRMGFYNDLSVLGMNNATVLNNRMSQQATLAALKKMAPDVYENLMKTMDANLRKQIGG